MTTQDDSIYSLLNKYLDGDDQKSKILDFQVKYFNDMKFYPGAARHHHCYTGGYYDHVLEVMNNCLTMLPLIVMGLVEFTSKDALVAAYFHDVDKIFYRYELDSDAPTAAQLSYARDLGADINTEFESKTSISFKIDAALGNKKYDQYDVPYFKRKQDILPFEDSAIVGMICARNGIFLNDQVLSALACHHGGWSPLVRTFPNVSPTSLGILLHTADLISASCQGGRSLR
jgi:hypothetical protein